jgi:hypothetical protein
MWIDDLAVAIDESRPAADRRQFVRTARERGAFAALWAEAGVELGTHEVMVRCPFHDDRHPSLHIDPVGCRWFCFGCRRGGGLWALREIVGGPASETPVGATSGAEPTLASEVVVDVVGESAHQDELLDLAGGRRTWSGSRLAALARLVPDGGNRFDPEAVAVMIDGRPVGHLARPVARAYRPLVGAALASAGEATCRAEIRGGWERGGGDVGRFGVVLWLPEVPL